MRKACIELIATTKIACLFAGELGTGRCLYMVIVSEDMSEIPTPERWLNALNSCIQKADELKYEVARIRGKCMAELLN